MQEMQETGVRSLGWEGALEDETATHSSNLAWRIPGQRSLVSTSSLEIRDSSPASSGKNSRLSRRNSRGGALNRKSERNPSVVPQFQGTPRCLSPFQRSLFSLHASTFTPRIHSLHHVMSHVGQPCGKPRRKASRESHRSLDPRDGKCDTAATVREESSRACPHTR